MSSWTKILESAKPEEHVVQLYGADDQFLVTNASRYLAEGLRRDDGLLLIATPEHTRAILRHLEEEGADPSAARQSDQLLCLDARATLDRFMEDGQPDRTFFERVVGRALQDVRGRAASGTIRAFGEMVALLWTEGDPLAATRLEEYWNELLKGNAFSLFCAYPIDILEEDFPMTTLGAVLRTHTHLLAGSHTMLSSGRGARAG